jgi:precorrin-2 C(20)-methyltransferase
LEEYIRDFESIVIMKAYKNYETIVNLIKKYNLQNNTVIISNSSRDKEKIIIRDDIFIEKNEEYLTTILINKRWNL